MTRKSLLQSTFTFSLMTLISRVTGFIRELVFAYIFGATAGLDAFFIAYRIPNFLRRLFGEGAFSQAFIPVLSEYRAKHSLAEIRYFLSHMSGLMILGLSLFVLVAVLVSPWIVYIFAPGFIGDSSKLALTASMLQITFPYILFVSLAAYTSGVLNSYGRFAAPAFAPNFLNLALIGAALLWAPWFNLPVKALAWGVFIGGLLQLLFQLPAIYKLNLLPQPKFFWQDPAVKKVLKLMGPAIFGVSAAQIALFIDTLLASFLPSGSVSWLNFSDRLISFPLGVFGVAVATVVLPHLSRKYSVNSQTQFSKTLDWALKLILLIILPALIGLIMLAGPILITLFHYGKFSSFDVEMTRRSLLGFALGMPAFMLIKVLASAFYSRQDIKTPVKIAIIAVVTNIVLAAILIFPLKHAGLALATSLSSILNAGCLFYQLRRHSYYQPGKVWGDFWWRIVLANLSLAGLLWITSYELPIWLSWDGFTRSWHLALIGLEAALVYFLSLWLSGLKFSDLIYHD